MGKLIDITGVDFAGIVAVRRGRKKHKGYLWVFRCFCGSPFEAQPGHIRSGDTRSCGCLGHPSTKGPWKFDLMSPEMRLLYKAWTTMRQRCSNPNNDSYENYGGRGIKVCPEWNNFDQFVSDVGLRPTETHTLDRINNDGNYEPTNVRWATREKQNNNQRGRL